MKSLGVIETQGLVAAIQAVDAACKSAGVTCIGYRKVGAGLVSVCFEGEISAIHTAIERGVAVAGAADRVSSLVIARPERCVVEALSNLNGNPPPAVRSLAARAVAQQAAAETPTALALPADAPVSPEESPVPVKKGKK